MKRRMFLALGFLSICCLGVLLGVVIEIRNEHKYSRKIPAISIQLQNCIAMKDGYISCEAKP